MAKPVVDVAIVAWPVSPARLAYFQVTMEAMRPNLRATGYHIRYVVSIGSERDPDRRWCGQELADYLDGIGIEYAWRSGKECLGRAMNETVALCTSPYVLLVQDDSLLLRNLDLGSGLDLMERSHTIDVIRYGWSWRRGFSPTTTPFQPGWRIVDRSKPWAYSDNTHLRRSSFVDRFGPYSESRTHGDSEQKMKDVIKHTDCLILTPDATSCFHSFGIEPACFRDGRRQKVFKKLRGGT